MEKVLKTKLNFILIFAIIGIFLVSGCTSGTQQPAQSSPAGKSATSRGVELEVCAGMPQVGDAPFEAYCLMGLAAKYKDVSLCSKFSSDLRQGCYAIVAVASKDAAICEQAGSYRDACYAEYATNTKDAAVCDKITDVYQKDNCYSNAANILADASFCEKIKVATSKDNCYLGIAMRLQDKAYCDKISGVQKEDCLRNLGG